MRNVVFIGGSVFRSRFFCDLIWVLSPDMDMEKSRVVQYVIEKTTATSETHKDKPIWARNSTNYARTRVTWVLEAPGKLAVYSGFRELRMRKTSPWTNWQTPIRFLKPLQSKGWKTLPLIPSV